MKTRMEGWVDGRMNERIGKYKEVWTEYDEKRMEGRENGGKGI